MDNPIRDLYRELFNPHATPVDAAFWFILGALATLGWCLIGA